MIHLGVGQPSPHLFPLTDLADSAARAFSENDPVFLAYGDEKGNPGFRRNLAGFLSPGIPGGVDPETLLITNGNSQALDFICTHFSRPGDTVFVEEPSYFLALRIFRDRRLNLVGIPVDDAGMAVEALEDQLTRHRPAFIYTIPVHHNPASVTLTEDRRNRLVRICAENDLLIVADEVYQMLNYHGTPPPSLAVFNDRCPVISLGSFSKILAPGLRLGWLHTSRELADRLAGAGILESGGGFNPFASELVNTLLVPEENGLCRLEKNIRHLTAVYASRLDALYGALTTDLPPEITFTRPSGGYFIWAVLPKEMDANILRKNARDLGVDYNAGNLFSCRNALTNCIRFSFSLYDEDRLTEGVSRLAKCF